MRIERIDATTWRLAKSGKMRVDGIVFADGRLFNDIKDDPCLDQVANVACLPGIVGASLAMPDIHWGYGFPIGGVAAFDALDGVVSPGGVGYDINCGVRLIRSRLILEQVRPRLKELVDALFVAIPSGLGSHHRSASLSVAEMRQICHEGAGYVVRSGFGEREDLMHCEDSGRLDGADFSAVSPRAYERGKDQLGTLGSGNHFVEISVVDEVFLPREATVLGLSQNQVVFSVHTGSRGFGYQVCTESIEQLQSVPRREGIELPDRQLVCAPLKSGEGRRYFAAMACAANFAFANRQKITHFLRETCELFFRQSASALGLGLVYDVAHNIAKMEEHSVDGRLQRLCVHRKGATRSLPPGHPLVPEAYREIGQPVLVPGDMGRYSFVLVGAPSALSKTFGSCAHGAGRLLGRKQALKASKGRQIADELAHVGVVARAAGSATLREEMPDAYKDVVDVVRVAQKAGLALPVARLRPLGVVKG